MQNKQLERAEKLLKQLRVYIKYMKEYDKLGDKMILNTVEVPATRKQISKINNDRRSTGEAIMRIGHEIHCLCVESGFAAYEEWRYGDGETGNTMSGFSSQHIHYRKPERYESKCVTRK